MGGVVGTVCCHKCVGNPEEAHTVEVWVCVVGTGQSKAAGQEELAWRAEGGVLELTLGEESGG